MKGRGFSSGPPAGGWLDAGDRRARSVLDASPVAFLVVDADGRIVSADGALEPLLGYGTDDLVGRPAEALLPAGLRTFHVIGRAPRSRVSAGWAMPSGTYLVKHADGRDTPVEIHLVSITVDGADCMLATISDATERHHIEAALRTSEHRLAEAQRIAHLGSWTLDPAGGQATWSREVYHILGRDPDGPAIGLADVASFLSPDSVERVQEAVARAVQSGESWQLDLEVIRPDGSRGWASSRGEVERDEAGRVTGIHGTMLDITDRVAAERERARLVSAIEHSGDAITISELDGPIEYVNRAFTRLYGFGPAEVLGASLRILKSGHHTRDFWEHVWNRIRSGEAWSGFIVNRRQDGSLVEVETVMAPFRDASGQITGMVKADRDVTRERALEAQLRQSAKMEAIGQLAGGVAHDFNNMLTAIRGYAELVLASLPPDAEPERGDIDQIITAADRAAELTRQLLAFSRKQVLEPQLLDPGATVASIAPMLRRLLGEDVELRLARQPDGGRVLLDPAQLEQIILNVAVNARDAMPAGGRLTIETSDVSLDEGYAGTHADAASGPHVMLAISDTGTGMDPEVLSHIFEPFFTTKEAGKGTGMGLATVYGIVRQSGGAITVYSEPGHGTTFRIYFPRVIDHDATVHDRIEPAFGPPRPGEETILLVEDESAVRGFAARALTDRGYAVLEAADGADAIDVARTHDGRIALLVTDVVMPGMRGAELAQRLTAEFPEMRVLFISGFTELGIGNHGGVRPEGAYLAKPFSAEGLARAVGAALDAAG